MAGNVHFAQSDVQSVECLLSLFICGHSDLNGTFNFHTFYFLQIRNHGLLLCGMRRHIGLGVFCSVSRAGQHLPISRVWPRPHCGVPAVFDAEHELVALRLVDWHYVQRVLVFGDYFGLFPIMR